MTISLIRPYKLLALALGSLFFSMALPAVAALPLDQLGSALGQRIAGTAAPAALGLSVASAGDFNGDGYPDVLLAAPNAARGATPGVGQVYVIYGTSVGIPTVNIATLSALQGCVISSTGAAASSQIGLSVVGLGDFDGDGIDDIAIGSAIGDFGATQPGLAWIVRGRNVPAATLDLDTAAGITCLTGNSNGDGFGTVLAAGGSVNGDARPDLIIGAPYAVDFGGAAYLIYGSSVGPATLAMSALNGSNGTEITDSVSFDFSGIAVAIGGDVNGDGIGDIVLGAFGIQDAQQHDVGGAYVIYGKAGGFGTGSVDLQSLSSTAKAKIIGTYYSASGADSAGSAVAFLKDQNGDGKDEIVVADPDASPLGRGFAGEVSVIYGAATLPASMVLSSLNGATGFRYEGALAGDKIGSYITTADVSGDGIEDLVMDAQQQVNNTTLGPGKVMVAYGRAGLPASVDLAALQAEHWNGEIFNAPAGVTNLGAIGGLCASSCATGRLAIGAYTEQSSAGAAYIIARPDRIYYDGLD